MEHSENKKINVNINDLPSYEINSFLDSVSIQEAQKQKNDVSKIASSETTDVAENATNLPPSCEFVEVN